MTPAGPTEIRTARLALGPLGAEDVPRLVAGVGNYEVSRWLSVVPYPYRAADAERYLGRLAAGGERAWAIRDESGLVGVISISDELGFWLARPVWGRGYATEAGDAVVDAWFADRRAGDLAAGHFIANAASARVLGKLGFVAAGRRRVPARALSQTVESRAMVLTRARWQGRRRFRAASGRLRLRELRASDWRALRRLGGSPEVAPMLASLQNPWPEAEVKGWLERSRFRGRPGFRAAVCLKSGRPIGTVGLGGDPATLTYFLGRSYWGRGYATEAAAVFLAECYRRFDIDAVGADHFADNPAAGRVLGKLGFEPVGERRGTSAARDGEWPEVTYRLTRARFEAVRALERGIETG